MKKFLAVMVLAGTLVACNDSSDSSDTADTTSTTTTITTDTNTTISADTTGMSMDTTRQ